MDSCTVFLNDVARTVYVVLVANEAMTADSHGEKGAHVSQCCNTERIYFYDETDLR